MSKTLIPNSSSSRIICLSLFASLISLGSVSQNLIPNNFRAPLDIPPTINGSFGELRPNHFHSGVDFATNGVTGYKVFAVADGYVSRIKVSPIGYGKAVYVTHDNGYTTVYGHLERYVGRIDSFAIAKQYENQRFEIDESFKPNQMPVKAGEVIGLSGNSGSSGGPHLHFEVRETDSEKAMNPFLFRRDAADKVSPLIQGIRIYPLGDGATVMGKRQPAYFKVVKANGAYAIEGNPSIVAAGEIGFGIEAIDFVSNSYSKCGVYSILLLVNDKEVFQSKMDGFLFDQSRYINSFCDYGFKQTNSKWVMKSYLEPNNKLEIFPIAKNNGKVELNPDEKYVVTYIVSDSYGNSSKLVFAIRPNAMDKTNMVANAEKKLSYNKSHDFEEENIRVGIPANCFYDNVLFPFKEIGKGAVSGVWRIGDRSTPLHLPINVEMKVPAQADAHKQKLALARKDASGKLFYAPSSYQFGWVIGKVRETGDYTLVVDGQPPVVALKNPAPSNNYKGRTSLEISAADNFSGLAEYNCYIDGAWALLEYDPKTNRLVCPLNRIPIKKNQTHAMKVEVKDACGNATVKNWTFVY